MSKKRKWLVGISLAMAAWATLGIVVLFSGALAGSVQTQEELQVLGAIIFVTVFIPSFVGIGLAFGSMDRRLGNPPVIWAAVVWNSITVGVLLLLTIVGTFAP